MTSRPKGFTLIELLVVMAIIAMLASMILPVSRHVREAANRARCAARLSGLAAAYLAYTEIVGRFPPVWHRSEFKGYDARGPKYATWFPTTHTYCMFVEHRRFDVGFGPLMFHGYASDPSGYVCPLVEDSAAPWWHDAPQDDFIYLNFHGTNPNPAKLLAEWWRTPNHRLETYGSYSSYALRPGLHPYGLSEVTRRGVRAFIADSFHYPEVVLRRHVSGVNVAYLDGHVSYCNPPILIDNEYVIGAYYPLGNRRLEDTSYGRIWQALDDAD